MCRPWRARHIAPGLAINRLAYDSSFSAVQCRGSGIFAPLMAVIRPLYGGYSFPYIAVIRTPIAVIRTPIAVIRTPIAVIRIPILR
jgi:hypothetical protein